VEALEAQRASWEAERRVKARKVRRVVDDAFGSEWLLCSGACDAVKLCYALSSDGVLLLLVANIEVVQPDACARVCLFPQRQPLSYRFFPVGLVA
jgi:hypothetical protein